MNSGVVGYCSAAGPPIGETVKRIRRSVVVKIRAEASEPIDVCAARDPVQRGCVECRSWNRQAVHEGRRVDQQRQGECRKPRPLSHSSPQLRSSETSNAANSAAERDAA